MIGLSSTYYAVKELSIYESVRKIVDLGFSLVELGPTHLYEEEVWDILKKLKRDFPKIDFTIHTLFPPLKEKVWFNPAYGLNNLNRTIIDNLFTAADILGVGLVSIHSPILDVVDFSEGRVPGGFWKPAIQRGKLSGSKMGSFLELMKYVDEKAHNYGIKVGIENLDSKYFNAMLSSKDEFIEIFDRFNSTGLVLDIAHALLDSKLEEFIGLNGHIFEVHLHENKNVAGEGTWGHFAITDINYYKPIPELILRPSLPIIFEHGNNVSEEEILREKKMLEELILAEREVINVKR